MITHVARPSASRKYRRTRIVLIASFFVAAMAGVSAHVVRGLINPTLATAFVSSPSAGSDAPIKIMWGTQDTGLRVACFNVANTAVPRVDKPGWPRVTAVGFELPGAPTGFRLLEPLESEWKLVERLKAAVPGHGPVTLDFALVTRTKPRRWSHKGPFELAGIPPGQPAIRGSGTRFCVSGPFPDTLPDPAAPQVQVPTTIEQIINGVIVAFSRVQTHGAATDVGVWESPLRTIPLYQ